MKKFTPILFILFFICPVFIRAEETEKERLVRIETKLDILIEQNKALSLTDKEMDVRISQMEQKVGILWFVVITMGIPLALTSYKAILDVIKKKSGGSK